MLAIVRAVTACVALAAATICAAQSTDSYPQRPVRMVVGYATGGGADALARVVASKLSAVLGQQVIVDNRPGAGATIAADLVAKAPPDGYTLYFADTAILIAPSVMRTLISCRRCPATNDVTPNSPTTASPSAKKPSIPGSITRQRTFVSSTSICAATF